MTKVVHFDEVEVVSLLDQIRLLIKSLKSHLICLLTLFGHEGMMHLLSISICD